MSTGLGERRPWGHLSSCRVASRVSVCVSVSECDPGECVCKCERV